MILDEGHREEVVKDRAREMEQRAEKQPGRWDYPESVMSHTSPERRG